MIRRGERSEIRIREKHAMFAITPEVSIRDGFAALRLKLWDEDGGRLVRFPQRGKLAARERQSRLGMLAVSSPGSERTT